jgi:hypothetical protein
MISTVLHDMSPILGIRHPRPVHQPTKAEAIWPDNMPAADGGRPDTLVGMLPMREG